MRGHVWVDKHIRLNHGEIYLHSADYLTPVFIWTLAECALAVISACLPTLRPILSRGSATTASHNQTHHPHTSSIRLVQMEESTGKEYNKVEDGKREDNDSVEIGSLTTT